MIPNFREVKCIMCGEESRQHCGYLSFNSHTFSYDFFGNPNIDPGVQHCPHCGYANEKIDTIVHTGMMERLYNFKYPTDKDIAEKNKELYPKIKELMETEKYMTCDNHEDLLKDDWEYVIKNYRSFLIHEYLEDYDTCAFTLMHLMWTIDHRYLALYAKDIIGSEEYEKLRKRDFRPSECELAGIKRPRFGLFRGDNRKDTKETKEYVKKILLWMLEPFFKYVKQFIDSYDEETTTNCGIESYVILIINYIYYQRRYGDFKEAEKYLDLLNEIPKKNNVMYYVTNKIMLFYQIEKENIACIYKNKAGPFMINNAFGEYDKAELDYIDRLDYVSRMKLYNDK